MIAIDNSGPEAPPRRNGELVFDAPWQGRAFGICVAVLEREGLGWDAFRVHLVRAIDAMPDAEYYEQFVEALGALIETLEFSAAAPAPPA